MCSKGHVDSRQGQVKFGAEDWDSLGYVVQAILYSAVDKVISMKADGIE